MKLDEVQQLFHGVLVGDVDAKDPRLTQVLVSDARLASPERLQIYAEMYLHRLVDALAAEFTLTRTLLGEDAFFDLSREYVRAHPSEDPDIGRLGRRLPEFVRAHAGIRGDLAELAELELIRSEVFAAADVEPRSWAELTAAGPESFVDTRLKFAPSLRSMTSAFDLPTLWTALQAGETTSPQKLASAQVLAVWKKGFEVFHAPLSDAEAQALARARSGAPLGEVCEVFVDAEDPAAAAFEAIASWFTEGWVEAIVPPGATQAG